MRILYLEDEPVLGRIVKESLESRACTVDWFTSESSAAAALLAADAYHIAVLDVQLPGRSGLAIGKELRAKWSHLPILYLTARIQAKDAVAGFEAGGNDYIRKPFSMEELLIRMRNLVNMRSGEIDLPAPRRPEKNAWVLGNLKFDYLEMTLIGPKSFVSLSHREARLLRYLLQHRHEPQIERRDILLTLWGDDGFFHSRNLDVYIRKLRTYLQTEDDLRIITLRGVGYRLILPGDATDT
ncbi:winged helix family two component transcriptional regulator [Neolewinella xylanilytica]|uniref:Winged helix family two component transcriptional regulator n=1 Tax=Neolewinella xylanilytica TaxID=1514080 RepID=A0A2S6I575_9BACT|nr:response regulator transcription factor [Neolewinella xylanilytica]PPK86327.1 winged helix family two component transcriptional regulator [Neolewinella xylanilytica]